MSETSIDNATRRARAKVEAVVDAAQDQVASLKGRARHVAEGIQDKAHDWVDEGQDKAHQVYGRFEDYVYSKPLQAVALGVGLGFIIAIFLRSPRTVYIKTPR
jgi:ElaB/YqjD/DUF883 family membrane-anchored ribosome-binding protein